jgi:uncharacterized small protein (DUF1192 family)
MRVQRQEEEISKLRAQLDKATAQPNSQFGRRGRGQSDLYMSSTLDDVQREHDENDGSEGNGAVERQKVDMLSVAEEKIATLEGELARMRAQVFVTLFLGFQFFSVFDVFCCYLQEAAWQDKVGMWRAQIENRDVEIRRLSDRLESEQNWDGRQVCPCFDSLVHQCV